MPDVFDPYYKWLAIPPDEQPANYYRLLGLKAFEADPEVIDTAADRQMAHVRSFQVGKHAAESQKLLNELSVAKLCLLSADKKKVYDQSLRARLAQQQPAAPAAAPTSPAAPTVQAGAPPGAAKPAPAQAKPLRLAQAQPLRPVQSPAASGSALDFDPLDQSNAPRHKRRKSAGPQPALLMGAGAAVLVIVGLIWALAGGGSDAPQQLSAKPRSADPTPKDAIQNSIEPLLADQEPKRSQIDRPASKVSSAKKESDDDASAPAESTPDDLDPADMAQSVMPPDDEEDDLDSAGPDSAEPEAAPSRTAVPSGDALKSAIADIQSLFKAEFSAAKKPDQKIALAEKLLGLAKDSETPLERYTLRSEGERLATSAGAFGLAMQAIDAISDEFDAPRLALAAEMVDAAGDKEMPAAARKELVEIVLPLVDEAVSTGQFKLARHLATAGLAAARKANASDASKTLARQAHDLAAQEKLAESADAARKLLDTKPDDAEAHLTLGKYLCLVASDWDAGLVHLKQGSDAPLRSIAERELDGAESATDRMKLGDLWWDLSDDQKGADKDRYRARAGYWYEQAVGELTGLSKTKVEKRLADLPARAVPVPAKTSRGGVIADKLVLWNCRSIGYNDRGTRTANIELRQGGQVVWSKSDVPVAWSEDAEPATTIPLPKIPFDAVRVEGVTFHGGSPALCEVEVFRGRENLARGKPVTASGILNTNVPAAAVVDGVRDSSKLHVGYWIGPNLVPSWVEVQVAPAMSPVAKSGKSNRTQFLSELKPEEVRTYSGSLTHNVIVGGIASPHGIGLHPTSGGSSHVAYDLDGAYEKFSGRVGINDSAMGTTESALRFRIVGDGRELAKSRPLQKTGDSEVFEVSVAKIRRLELFVDCPGGDGAAHAVWIEPQLTVAAGRSGSSSNEPKHAAVGKWIDLLPLVDPAQQHLEAAWERIGHELRVGKPTTPIQIPRQIASDYTLHVEFTRLSGSGAVGVILPAMSKQCMLVMSAPGQMSGLEAINEKWLRDSPTTIRPGILENNRRYRLDITVHQIQRHLSIESKLDDEPYVHWNGEVTSLGLWHAWTVSREDVVALGADEPTVFHVVKLKILKGEANIDGDAPGHASARPTASSNVGIHGKMTGGLLKGAVLIATFDEPTILRKNGAVRVRDLSGKQKPGLVVGAEFVPGKSGRALKFRKAGDHVDFGTDLSLSPASFTVCAWVMPAPHDNAWNDVFSKHSDGQGGAGLVMRIDSNQPEFGIGIGDRQWHFLRPGVPIPLEQWSHLAAAHDAGTSSIYINGQLAKSAPSDGAVLASPAPCYIGLTRDHDELQFYGLIDELALFDRALSAVEVQHVYQLGMKGKSLAAAGPTLKTTAAADENRTTPAPASEAKPANSHSGTSAALPAGAKLYLSFAGDTTSITGDSIRVNDLSGRSNGATSAGAAALVKGKVGQALALNRGELRLTPSLNGLANFTVSAWVCLTGSEEFILFEEGNIGGPGARILVSPSREIGLELWNFNGPPDNWLRSHTKADVVPAGKWCHIALRLVDGAAKTGKAIVSINGKSLELPAQSMNGHPSTFARIGGAGSAMVDEVAIFDRALTDAEINGIYQTGLKQKMLVPAK